MLAVTVTAGCDALDPEPEAAPTGCAATVADAAQAGEVDQQVKLLDTALIACRSYNAFTDELGRYPGIIGYDPATFASLRCTKVTDEAVRASPTCSSVIAPVTTPPPTTLPDLVFVGETLDGRQIELRPSATIRFDGDVPAVVQQTVDIFHESGCDGVIAQRDEWAARVTASTIRRHRVGVRQARPERGRLRAVRQPADPHRVIGLSLLNRTP